MLYNRNGRFILSIVGAVLAHRMPGQVNGVCIDFLHSKAALMGEATATRHSVGAFLRGMDAGTPKE